MSVRKRLFSPPSLPNTRLLALAGLAVTLGSVLVVLRDVVDISGDLSAFYLLIVASLAVGTVLARLLRVGVALALAGVALTVGLVVYVTSLSYDPALPAMVESNLQLLSGQSILEIERSTIWALSITPAPVFVTWYLGLRGWYGVATAVAGGLLGYLVLTGDAGPTVTLFGVIGGAAAIGFGDLHRRGASVHTGESVAVILAVMVLVPALVSVVPGSSGGTVELVGGGDGPDTIEANLLSAESAFEVAGSISLSPAVRFEVQSPESRYWRVSSYNRYTGDGWVRSGETIPYSAAELSSPSGESRRLTQQFSVESSTNAMPAAWRPIAVGSAVANDTRITSEGDLEPVGQLSSGDSYQVTSSIPVVSPEALSGAVGDDPSDIVERYTQLPASTPDRVARRTANLVGADSDRYQTARRIERWLETSRDYSLDVEKPEGNVADAFLFDMDAGYCTYYATTMVTMLRSQDVPARLAVGYTPGETEASGEYVVRGLNSHAWVEVYFPDIGWIQFDPTPAEPREQAEQARIADAPSGTQTPTPNETTPTPTATPDGTNATPTATPPDGGGQPTPTDSDSGAAPGSRLPELPSREQVALGAIVLVGLTAGVRRSRLATRLYRWGWLRYLPRSDPATDIDRAWQRVAYLLERRYRPRHSDETVRAYLDDIGAGKRVWRLATLRERVVYQGEATAAMATEARALVREIRRQ